MLQTTAMVRVWPKRGGRKGGEFDGSVAGWKTGQKKSPAEDYSSKQGRRVEGQSRMWLPGVGLADGGESNGGVIGQKERQKKSPEKMPAVNSGYFEMVAVEKHGL